LKMHLGMVSQKELCHDSDEMICISMINIF
jgi:hypothetical protein